MLKVITDRHSSYQRFRDKSLQTIQQEHTFPYFFLKLGFEFSSNTHAIK